MLTDLLSSPMRGYKESLFVFGNAIEQTQSFIYPAIHPFIQTFHLLMQQRDRQTDMYLPHSHIIKNRNEIQNNLISLLEMQSVLVAKMNQE